VLPPRIFYTGYNALNCLSSRTCGARRPQEAQVIGTIISQQRATIVIDAVIQLAVEWRIQVVGHGGGAGLSGSGTTAQQQAARKVTRMCMTIATTFTVAWLPYQLDRLVMVYGNYGHALMILDAAEALSFVNSCVNPIIYALLWRPFRQSLIQVRPPSSPHHSSISVRSNFFAEMVIEAWIVLSADPIDFSLPNSNFRYSIVNVVLLHTCRRFICISSATIVQFLPGSTYIYAICMFSSVFLSCSYD